MQLSWFPLMPAWDIRETSDSLQRLESPKKEEAGWHRLGVGTLAGDQLAGGEQVITVHY